MQIPPNRNILNAVTRNVEAKRWRRSTRQIIRGWENFAIFDIISRYISVTVQNSPIIAAGDN